MAESIDIRVQMKRIEKDKSAFHYQSYSAGMDRCDGRNI